MDLAGIMLLFQIMSLIGFLPIYRTKTLQRVRYQGMYDITYSSASTVGFHHDLDGTVVKVEWLWIYDGTPPNATADLIFHARNNSVQHVEDNEIGSYFPSALEGIDAGSPTDFLYHFNGRQLAWGRDMWYSGWSDAGSYLWNVQNGRNPINAGDEVNVEWFVDEGSSTTLTAGAWELWFEITITVDAYKKVSTKQDREPFQFFGMFWGTGQWAVRPPSDGYYTNVTMSFEFVTAGAKPFDAYFGKHYVHGNYDDLPDASGETIRYGSIMDRSGFRARTYGLTQDLDFSTIIQRVHFGNKKIYCKLEDIMSVVINGESPDAKFRVVLRGDYVPYGRYSRTFTTTISGASEDFAKKLRPHVDLTGASLKVVIKSVDGAGFIHILRANEDVDIDFGTLQAGSGDIVDDAPNSDSNATSEKYLTIPFDTTSPVEKMYPMNDLGRDEFITFDASEITYSVGLDMKLFLTLQGLIKGKHFSKSGYWTDCPYHIDLNEQGLYSSGLI